MKVYNVINKSSSDQLREKFMPEKPKAYTLRSQTEEKVNKQITHQMTDRAVET